MKLLTMEKIAPILLLSLGWYACSTPGTQKVEYDESLTFYASFDSGFDANYAKGDATFYTAPGFGKIDSAVVGPEYSEVEILPAEGLKGGALRFNEKVRGVALFKSKGNVSYSKENFVGTVSFWLKLDPAIDLEEGFCDPIQITDARYDDGAIWVDFTGENPRDFRLGVFPDSTVWKLDTVGVENPYQERLVKVTDLPFSREKWAHVAIVFDGLNTQGGKGALYLNGQLQGVNDQIDEPFTWEIERSVIYLGLSYIGLMDELAIYDKALSEDEVSQLFQASSSLL